MDRQNSAPILLTEGGTPLQLQQTLDGLEDGIQHIVHTHPRALPIADIDPIFAQPVAICREMQLGNGRVDNFLITPSGLPVLVECKLWRNPESRRQVIGQILEYAQALSRWSYSDLQREVSARTGRGQTALLDFVREADPTVEEDRFHDAVTFNLRRGRFLLLIVGDGIRDDVETIANYLQAYAGLHFTFGLVELPIYALPNGEKLVAPRVVARTTSIVRNVIGVPDGHVVQEPSEISVEGEADPDQAVLSQAQQAFWDQFISNYLHLDDASQPIPKPPKLGYVSFILPAPQGSSWITAFRDMRKGEVGVMLSASQNSPGESAMRTIVGDWDAVGPMLGGTAQLSQDRYGRLRILEERVFGNLDAPDVRSKAFKWLAERVNAFINVLRPRVRDAILDDQEK